MAEGLPDWKKYSCTLKGQERSPEHTMHLITRRNLELCLKTGRTIDQAEKILLGAKNRP